MILVRNIFQAKYGRGDELVALLKEGEKMMTRSSFANQRVLTDVTGQFFTVVMEHEVPSLAEYEKSMALMGDPDFGPWFARMTELVDNGRREIFTIVQ